MNRSSALKLLESQDQQERLRAARYLSRFATGEDAETLRQALRDESVHWIRQALYEAIDRSAGASVNSEFAVTSATAEEDWSEDATEDLYAEAVEHTTRRILHELEPVIGALSLFAEQEIESFEHSHTKEQITRLRSLMEAIDRLSSAATPASFSEFDLARIARETAEGVKGEFGVRIRLAGRSPFLVVGDDQLIVLVLQNALRNAAEAMLEVVEDASNADPIVVNWGETDREYWVAVLDYGKGPPSGLHRAFDIGTSTKRGHIGMGLAIAHQAMRSLSGKMALEPREREGGARLEFRWPKLAEAHG